MICDGGKQEEGDVKQQKIKTKLYHFLFFTLRL